MNRILTRVIKKDEVIEMARKITESYLDYPIYQTIIGDTSKKRNVVLYQTWLRLFTNYNRVYTNEDKTVCVSVIEPGDKIKMKTIFEIIKSPELFQEGIKCLTPKNIYLLSSYGIMNAKFHRKIYNPRKDYFIKALWIDPSLRGSEVLDEMLNDIMNNIVKDDYKVFFETDSDKHVMLYRWLGAKECASIKWKGVKHTLMSIDNPLH